MQEGIIGECPVCHGRGDDGGNPPWEEDVAICPTCNGDGIARINHDVQVIQLGDLGHFGSNRLPSGQSVVGSASADLFCYKAAADGWIDIVLWGNHDRAVEDGEHGFTGYVAPPMETVHVMKTLQTEGKLKLAAYVDGFLLTHAGLHKQFKYQNGVEEALKLDPKLFAAWLNCEEAADYTSGPNDGTRRSFVAIRDAIGKFRGGASPHGGILWRDATEKLYTPFRQVFGHSAKDKVRKYETEGGWSYCIDVGSADNGRLAGIWLPREVIVEVQI